jgi:hypothetical protein
MGRLRHNQRMQKSIDVCGLSFTKVDSVADWERFAKESHLGGYPEQYPALVYLHCDPDERLVPVFFGTKEVRKMSQALGVTKKLKK